MARSWDPHESANNGQAKDDEIVKAQHSSKTTLLGASTKAKAGFPRRHRPRAVKSVSPDAWNNVAFVCLGRMANVVEGCPCSSGGSGGLPGEKRKPRSGKLTHPVGKFPSGS
jgi:hypothetical protein